MLIVRYIAARISKIIGNLLKIVCYAIFPLMRCKRFSIPHRSPPLWQRPSTHRIPKIIWQTNYTDRVTLPVYLNYLFNRLMSPTYEYRFMDTAERAAFIAQNAAPDVAAAYDSLQIGAAQADVWRLLILHRFGGVYLDIDAHVVWPLGFMIGRGDDELFLLDRNKRLTNYFIASVAGNPHLDRTIALIVQRIRKRANNWIFEMTGPLALDVLRETESVPTALYKYTCYQGSFTDEYFQYIDHPQGKWKHAQKTISIVKP